MITREQAGWLRAKGFAKIQIIPQPMVFDTWDFVKDWIVGPALPSFDANDSMSAMEARSLVEDLPNWNETGHFFAASTLYTVTGQRV